MSLARLRYVDSEPECLTVVAMLQAHGIYCYVHNEGFGGLLPGLQIEHYNRKTIMVAAGQLEEAQELLAPYFAMPADTTDQYFDWLDITRCFLEYWFGWMVVKPREKKRRT
jgi:hypothetical protein